MNCTCMIVGADYDDTTFDPLCPFHGDDGSMVAVVPVGERRTCRGCGEPLPPPRGHGRAQVWCSDRCRKQQYAGECVYCGAPTNGYDGPGKACLRCHRCARIESGARAQARGKLQREIVERLWAQGLTSMEIARIMGVSEKHGKGYIARCRYRGYNVPVRNEGASVYMRAHPDHAEHWRLSGQEVLRAEAA